MRIGSFNLMELATCLWIDGHSRKFVVLDMSIFPDGSIADSCIAPTATHGNKMAEEINQIQKAHS
jgi:hypothetical protein